VQDSGAHDPVAADAAQLPVEQLPDDVLVYLLPSRYCETDKLADIAWELFKDTPPGWARAQAINDYVHNHIAFDYKMARPTKTAFEVYHEKTGVCRDYAHLAVAFCRCMNIPARYVTGYLGDIGVPPDPAPMDFSGWHEVYLSGRWHTFDARHNARRIGRILMATGRDAADVALTTSFGHVDLKTFIVHTDEVVD
jgi:transglutaminase-like putative cysteine protease